jgi:predicted transcriptional regulator
MATITLRVPDKLKATMDELDEINWSAVTRNLLQEKVEDYFIREKLSKSEKQIEEGKIISHEEVKNKYLKNG